MFKHGDVIQHISRTGPRFVVRLVDDVVGENYAENLDGGQGTRVINHSNWCKIGILHLGEVVETKES